MTNTAYQLDDFAVPLPIAQAGRNIAQKFAKQQVTPAKAEQVLWNTLAVWVVNEYLQMMDIPTDLLASDSWNSLIRLCADVADLNVPDIGRLECRPIRSHEQVLTVPPENWRERVGYVAVQIDESLLSAKLLGFVPSVTTEQVPLSQLRSPEAFLEHLGNLRQSPVLQRVNLGEWFAGICASGWQTMEELWNSEELRPAYAFRAPTVNQSPALARRAKLIDLGIQIAHQTIILIVEIYPEANQKTGVRLQLHPTASQVYLPQGIQLTVLDESGAVFLEAQARSADNYIQLQFRGDARELFGVRVSFNDTSITEHFVI